MRCMLPHILLTTLASTAKSAQLAPLDLTSLLQANSNLTQFATLLTSYGDLYANLSFQQNITILAPNNDAFAKIPNSPIGAAFANNQSDAIRAILEYHIIPGLHPSTSYNGSFQFHPTWLTNSSYTNVPGGQVVGGVAQAGNVNIYTSGYGSRTTVIQPDLAFVYGLLHTIDTFLLPPVDFPTTSVQFNLTSVRGAIAHASLTPSIASTRAITIFAPNNDAFQALGQTLTHLSPAELASLLSYHVVAGPSPYYSPSLLNGTVLRTNQGGALTMRFASNSLFVNAARVLQQDILLANGVMHVLDNVLSPNASAARPVPAVRIQAPVIRGTPIRGNVLPFSQDAITGGGTVTATLPASASASGPGATSSAVDAGSGGASAAAATATGSAKDKGSKKAGGQKIEVGRLGAGLGAGFGAAMAVLGGL